MKKSERAELVAAIAKMSEHYPEWRLGQMLANIADWADADIWNVEDLQLLSAARAHLDTLSRQAQQAEHVH